MKTDVYILNYNRPEMLALCLAGVTGFNAPSTGSGQAVTLAGCPVAERRRVHVLDDASTDPAVAETVWAFKAAGLVDSFERRAKNGGIGPLRRRAVDRFLASDADAMIQVEGDMLLPAGGLDLLVRAWTELRAAGYAKGEGLWLNAHNHDWCHKITERKRVAYWWDIGLSCSNSEPLWMTDRLTLETHGSLIVPTRPDLIPFLKVVGATTILTPQIQAQHLGVLDSFYYPPSKFAWATWHKLAWFNHDGQGVFPHTGTQAALRQPFPWFAIDFDALQAGDWRSALRGFYAALRAHAPMLPELNEHVLSGDAQMAAQICVKQEATTTAAPSKSPRRCAFPFAPPEAVGSTSGMSVALGALSEALMKDPRFVPLSRARDEDIRWHPTLTDALMHDLRAGHRVAIGPQVSPQNCLTVPINDVERKVLESRTIVASFTFSRWLADLLSRKMPEPTPQFLLDFPIPGLWRTIHWEDAPVNLDALVYVKGGAAEASIADAICKAIPNHLRFAYGQHDRPALLDAARRSKVTYYLSAVDGFSLAAIEIGLMGCPIVSDEKSCPAVIHGLTGIIVPVRERDSLSPFAWAKDSAERLLVERGPATAIPRDVIRKAVLDRGDPARMRERVAAALKLGDA